MACAMQGQGSITKSRWQKIKQHFSEAFSQEFVYQRSDYDSAQVDRLVKKRGRDAYRYILLLLAVILAPMDVMFVYARETLSAVAGLLLLALVLVNVWLLSRQRHAFLSPTLLLLSSIALIFLSVLQGHQSTLFWLYPLLVALPVLLRYRWAIVMGLVAGMLVLPLVFLQFDLETAVVLSFSMLFTWLVSAWLVFALTEQSRRLRGMAITDPLTGAYNRRYLEEQAQQALHAWRRYSQPSAILLIDIDHFKRVNDRFGHNLGDAAIKRLVGVISERVRSVDTVCRFGGEEFVVLLSETTIETASNIAEQLRALVESERILPEGTMTISIGVCDVTVADTLDRWLNLADAALYRAKSNGRNRVEVATPIKVSREPIVRTVPNWR
jgi:diguanylate cyclase (GGDEF)-like protein